MRRADYASVFADSIHRMRAELFRRLNLKTPREIAEHAWASLTVAKCEERGGWLSQDAHVLVTARPDQAQPIIDAFRIVVTESGDLLALARFMGESTVWLNRLNHFDVARQLIDNILDAETLADADLPAPLVAHVYNEIGNTFRYTGSREHALGAYQLALDAGAGLPGEDQHRSLVNRNRALVLRDSGRFGEAKTILDDEFAANPDDPELHHSIAVFHILAGRPAEAVDWLSRALRHPEQPWHRITMLMLTRASLRQLTGDIDGALTDVVMLWRASTSSSVDLRLRVAALYLRLEHPDETSAQCHAFILHHLTSAVIATDATLAAVAAVAEEALRSGDHPTARLALSHVVRHPASVPGELSLLWAWLLVEEDRGEDPWPWLRACMTLMDSEVPCGDDAGYALTWLTRHGRLVDRILAVAVSACLSAEQLLAVYDLANGRELGVHEATTPPVERASLDVGCDVVALIDGDDRQLAVVIPLHRKPLVVTIALTGAELDVAVREFGVFQHANPVAPHRADDMMRHWWEAMRILANAIRPYLTDSTELVFMPGRRLASTALHLAGWPDQPLIAERPVSTCPNLRMWVGPDTARVARRFTIVSVPKDGESESQVAQLRGMSTELVSQFPPAHGLHGVKADRASVLASCFDSAEVAFLCHGLSSIQDGPGLCLAAHGYLPPATLSLQHDRDLAEFVLSWSGFFDMAAVPPVVVTIACSSGRTIIGAGGTRIGLEQGHLARGGIAMVGPLWNVDLQYSLTWLRAFYSHHQPGNLGDLAAAHRAACLAAMQEHPHPFAWGGFQLTRRLHGVPT